MVSASTGISQELLYQVGYEVNKRAAIVVPQDGLTAFGNAWERESKPLAAFILGKILENAKLAVADARPMCGDTGLPRYYVKLGNEARIDGGFVALERSLRRAVADVTQDIQLRANRVHPLTRKNPGNNLGVFAPNIDYSFEPDGDWIDIIAVHKGGLFGTDYRMLFPADGIDGIKRFLLDNMAEFARRGLSCPPVVVGVGLGGTKDQAVSLSKEAACLRLIGNRTRTLRSWKKSYGSWLTKRGSASWVSAATPRLWMCTSRSLTPTPAACPSPYPSSAPLTAGQWPGSTPMEKWSSGKTLSGSRITTAGRGLSRG